MNSHAILRVLLLLVVAGSLAFWFLRADKASAESGPTAEALAKASVVVTYFTTDVRCDSCRKIEALSRRAVDEGFPAQLESGELVFRVVNTDRPANAHYIDHYEIGNKIVIVSRQVEGKEVEWMRCQDVWLHFDEPEEFLPYVQKPIREYLAKS